MRFELTDRVRLATEGCPCGRPFALVARIEGRTDDVLTLPAAAGGTVAVHPVLFHSALDLLDAAGWQVRQDGDGLTVLLAAPGRDVDPVRVSEAVTGALRAAGAGVPVRTRRVDAIPAGAAGKRPRVVALRGATTGPPDSSP